MASNILSLRKARVGLITIEILDEHEGGGTIIWNQNGAISSKVPCSKVAGLRLGDELLKIHDILHATQELLASNDPEGASTRDLQKKSLLRQLNEMGYL